MCNIIYKFTLLSLHLLINFFSMRGRTGLETIQNREADPDSFTNNLRHFVNQYHKGGKFLKKLWCYVGGEV